MNQASDDHDAGAPTGDSLAAEFSRWLADQRVDAAAASRARHHWLRQQLGEEATVAGILLDVAERELTIVVETLAGRRHRAQVSAVGDDFCSLRSQDGTETLLAYGAIGHFQAQRSAAGFAGSRPAALNMTFAEALAALVGERPRLLVTSRSGSASAGELRSVGRNVLVLQPDGSAGSMYVPIDALSEVTVVR